jgi:hypothetical protein
MARSNDATKGWVKGRPLKYLRGHNVAINGARQTELAIGRRGLSSHGYVRILVSKGVRRYEHIVIAERVLGRPLHSLGRGHPDTEVVHHIDGDKTNNAPSNLLICTPRYHTELHHRLELSAEWPEFPKVTRNEGPRHV